MSLRASLLMIFTIPCIGVACAQETSPLEMVAESPVLQAEDSGLSHKLRVEATSGRFRDRLDLAVPLYSTPDPPKVDHLFADGWFQWKPNSKFTARLSGRLGGRFTAGATSSSELHSFITFREGWVGWRLGDATFLEIGRIVERNGSAFGGNPTDYLRSFSVVDTITWDPRESRENRLGVAMVRISRIGEKYSWNVNFAPRLTSHMPADNSGPSMNVAWNRTNWQ